MKQLPQRYFFFIFFSLFFSLALQSQNIPKKLSLLALNEEVLEKLILEKINEHRKELKIQALVKDLVLQKAAKDQSNYQRSVNKVTHDQITLHKETPYKRVAFYKGTHSVVGENCANVPIGVKTKIYGTDSTITINDYYLAANAFYCGWKNSPGHYANMIHPDYYTTGIRFSVDNVKKMVYATQVFGGIPYTSPPGIKLDEYDFGIKDGEEKACESLRLYRFNTDVFANNIITVGDSIYINYHDPGYMRKVIGGPNDGLAIDIVERRQFPCAKPNLLHGSAVHDGVLLAPVYSYEIFNNNQGKSSGRIFSPLGKIPKGMTGDYQYNVIVIKNNNACRVSFPITTIYDDLPLFKFNVMWDTISGSVQPDTVKQALERWIYFQKNNYQFHQKEMEDIAVVVKKHIDIVKRVYIRAYSSVEGEEKLNLDLQENRAKEMKKYLDGIFKGKIEIRYEASENWDLFYQQIKGTAYDELKDEKKDAVKELLKDPKLSAALEPWLAKQRTVGVFIEIDGVCSDNGGVDNLELLLNSAVRKNKPKAALVIQSRLIKGYLEKKIPLESIPLLKLPLNAAFASVIANQMAIELSRGTIETDSLEKDRLRKYFALDKTSMPLQFNLSCMAIRYMYYIANSVLEPAEQERKINSFLDSASYIGRKTIPGSDVARLLINFHLAAVKYYYEKLDYDNKRRSMEAIKKYFTKANITEDETLALAKYFNNNYYFDWTLQALEPWAVKENVKEETLFTFIQTIPLVREDYNTEKFIEFLNKAKKRNNKRLCAWLHHDFQLMRTIQIKKIYCESCQ